ncbi:MULTISPECIES: NmrA/HSCARG family protein [Protofrankia]|uniref:NmrA family protein n=1 Tax=Candidatus Protofrankia datiscae TaxID=2716812 RepID=F8B6Q8_9ACTN|nr:MULTISPECIES: NmrA/HSCARG family protein [Protofrankia]AEH10273.1 NmrA family protein [Candidatus Protofrankia datiscae]
MRDDDETTNRYRTLDGTPTEGIPADRASMVILVAGATGKQGGAAAARLLADGWRVRALTRDPTRGAARRLAAMGAQVVIGDLDDRESLVAATEGAHGVFSVQQGALGMPPVPFDDEVRRGRNLADAAAAARVRHLVYASIAGVERGGGGRAFASKRAVEEHINRIGIPATVLRPVSFMENYADPAFGVQTGNLATPFAPDVPEQLVAVDDIGIFVALAFADPAAYLGRSVAIAGDTLRPAQTAEALSRVTGRTINYVQVPIEAVRGQSDDVADVASFLNGNGGYGADISAARLLHPKLMNFETWLSGQGGRKLAELFKGNG